MVGPSAPFPSVTVEGSARIVDSGIAPVTARIFARISGGDPPELAEADLAAMRRVLIEIDVDHVYGTSYPPYTLERDEDGVWCAHGWLGSTGGANGNGATPDEAIADLRAAVHMVLDELCRILGIPPEDEGPMVELGDRLIADADPDLGDAGTGSDATPCCCCCCCPSAAARRWRCAHTRKGSVPRPWRRRRRT